MYSFQCFLVWAIIVLIQAQQHPKCEGLPDKCYESSPCQSIYYCCVDGQKFDEKCDSNLFFNEIAAICEKTPECMPSNNTAAPDGRSSVTVSVPKNQHIEFCTGEIDGQYPLGPNVCSRVYYICKQGRTSNGHCKSELRFDIVSHLCEIPDLVDACENVPTGHESSTEGHIEATSRPVLVGDIVSAATNLFESSTLQPADFNTSSPSNFTTHDENLVVNSTDAGSIELTTVPPANNIVSGITDLFENSTLQPVGANSTSSFNVTSALSESSVDHMETTTHPDLAAGIVSGITDLFENSTLQPIGLNFTSLFNVTTESSAEENKTTHLGLVGGIATGVTNLFESSTLQPIGLNFTSSFNLTTVESSAEENKTTHLGLVGSIATGVTNLFENSTLQPVGLNVTSSFNVTAHDETSISHNETTSLPVLVGGIVSAITDLFESSTLEPVGSNITSSFNVTVFSGSVENSTETGHFDTSSSPGLSNALGGAVTDLFENATLQPVGLNFTSVFNVTTFSDTLLENSTIPGHIETTSGPVLVGGIGGAVTNIFENSTLEPAGLNLTSFNFTSSTDSSVESSTESEATPFSEFVLNFDCMSRADGDYPDLGTPCTTRYLRCKNQQTEIRTCKTGKMFDDITLRCRHPSYVAACGGTPNFEDSGESEESVDEFCQNRTSGNFGDPDKICAQHFFTCTEEKQMSTGWCPFEQYYYPDKDICLTKNLVPGCLNGTLNETEIAGMLSSTELWSTSSPAEIPKQIFDCTNKTRGNYRDPWRTCSPTFYSCTKSGKAIGRTCYEGLFYDPMVNRCTPFDLSPVCNVQLPPQLKRR